MKEVIVPEGMDRIGGHWFRESGIENITIPASLKEIGSEAFYGCKSLKRVTFALESKLEKIGPDSFYGAGVERMTIPKSVEEIQDNAFRNCENLKEVIFETDGKLRKICDCAFYGCSSLRDIQFPDSLEIIGSHCF